MARKVVPADLGWRVNKLARPLETAAYTLPLRSGEFPMSDGYVKSRATLPRIISWLRSSVYNGGSLGVSPDAKAL
jgi:hypothetical protein